MSIGTKEHPEKQSILKQIGRNALDEHDKLATVIQNDIEGLFDHLTAIFVSKSTMSLYLLKNGLSEDYRQFTESIGLHIEKKDTEINEGESEMENNSDGEIEKSIRRKGLNAPRLTPDHIEAVIKSVSYAVLPSGETIVCELTLLNGFSVIGTSSIRTIDTRVGEMVALQNAKNKVWELEGYLLQEKIFSDYPNSEKILDVEPQKTQQITERLGNI